MMSSPFLTAVPLSDDHFKKIFEKTRSLCFLCSALNIPDDKRTVAGAVEYFRHSTEPRKWSKMAFCLDLFGDTVLADSVMEYAEPPAGDYGNTFCLHTISRNIVYKAIITTLTQSPSIKCLKLM